MKASVVGAGGAIGGWLVGRLLNEGWVVSASDIKSFDEWWQIHDRAQNIECVDCSESIDHAAFAVEDADWVFDLAENMGGIAWITNERVACAESIEIGINLLRASASAGVQRFFFSSSACVYNTDLQQDPNVTALSEDMAWPARAEDGYGFCKLYMEELCRHYREVGKLDTRIARYHNIYGPNSSWEGGKEKSPAALCRKVAEAEDGSSIEVWGDGKQSRSYCWMDDCIEGTMRLMSSDYPHPLNVGSDRLISVDDLARMVISISGKKLDIVHVPGPEGVRGRNSNNDLCRATLGWEPSTPLEDGMAALYSWVEAQVKARHS